MAYIGVRRLEILMLAEIARMHQGWQKEVRDIQATHRNTGLRLAAREDLETARSKWLSRAEGVAMLWRSLSAECTASLDLFVVIDGWDRFTLDDWKQESDERLREIYKLMASAGLI